MKKKFSIHLPDYISSSYLIDPISHCADVKRQSLELMEKVVVLAENLQELTGNEVPVVGSFSVMNDCKVRFYSELSELVYGYYQTNNVKIMPQFLPKIAWYFGGSVELNVFCDIRDLDYFEKLPFGLCLDVAHCIMAANYFDQSHIQWIEKLLPITGHMHVSDARGISGEGVPFGDGELEDSLSKILATNTRKVVEQWEGHLDDFRGFKESLNYLTQQHNF